MKYHILKLILLLLFSYSLMAQNTFIKRHHIKDYDNAYYTTIMATDTGYWAFGIIWDTTRPYLGGTAVYQFNLEGDLLHHNDYISKSEFRGFNKDMFYINGKFITTILHPYDSISIISYDIILDSFSKDKTIYSLLDAGNFIGANTLYFYNDHYYLAASVSSTQFTKDYTQIQLIKLNKLFDTIWSKTLGLVGIDEYPFVLKIDSFENIYIGGQRQKLNYIQGDNNFSKSLVYKLDPQGNLLKETVSEKLSGPVYDFIVDENQNYICATEELLPYHRDRPFPYPAYMNMDTNGLLKYRHYFEETPGKEKLYSSFIKIQKDKDNHIALGAIGLYDEDIQPLANETRAILIKFNNTGKLIWKRIYKTIDAIEGSNLYDFDLTSDAGVVMCGLGSYSTIEGVTWRSMLLKVDSFGCLVPGCQILDDTKNDTILYHFVTYPNPAEDYLAVYNPFPNKVKFKIYDLMGNELYTQNIVQYETGIMDVQLLSPGHYVITAFIKDKELWTGKWIKM